MIFIVPKGLAKGIVYSQIYKPAVELKKKGISSILAIHKDFKFDYEIISDIEVCFYSKYNELLPIIKKVGKVYTREYRDFLNIYLLTFFQKVIIHYSFRGLVFAESFYRNKNILMSSIVYTFEFVSYVLADELSCVSRNMKIHLKKYFFLNKKIEVIHCGISESYLKKKFNKKLHFVYLGGISKWQKIEESIKAYKILNENINRPTKLSILTTDISYINNFLSKNDKELYSISVLKLKPNEVTGYLRNCDFGFLLRDKSIVNKVSSPIKFIEYTSNGVIPIISPNIGDYSADVTKKKLGICLDEKNKIDHVAINALNELLDDFTIFDRIYRYSNLFLWSNVNSKSK